eukprot:GHUV01047452.1.p1 GENE.GHUV01047452.1~~GHUV01047452.1.p1  ORF type:complete len:122 (+),score=37.27 GHUV01047452.1:247-612(+)
MSREFLRKSLGPDAAAILSGNPEERHTALVNRLYTSYERVSSACAICLQVPTMCFAQVGFMVRKPASLAMLLGTAVLSFATWLVPGLHVPTSTNVTGLQQGYCGLLSFPAAAAANQAAGGS